MTVSKTAALPEIFPWEVPVDRPGFESKVFYVWFDAPIGYIAAAQDSADADPDTRGWRAWWLGSASVRHVQFLGKDDVPFHTGPWAATILGSQSGLKLADTIKGFAWQTTTAASSLPAHIESRRFADTAL